MNLTDKVTKKQIVILVILLVGLFAGVILVQRYQNLKSRATGNGPLNITTNEPGKEIHYDSNTNSYSVERGTEIQIELGQP